MAPIKRLQSKSSWFRLVLTLGTFAILVIFIYALREQIGEAISNLGKVHAWALLLVIPLQAINYDAYARMQGRLLAVLGEKISYRKMYRLTLELNFINHILPSGGISGISYFNMRARSFGIPTSKSTITQLTKLMLLYVSFQPLLVLGVLLLAARGHVNGLVLVAASSMVTLLIVGSMVAVYIAESRSRVSAFLGFLTTALNKIAGIFRKGKPAAINMQRAERAFNELHDNYELLKTRWREIKAPFVYAIVANITEIASVYVVYIAFGQLVNVGAIILAYAVANFAGLLSVLPAGIGVYEGLMTAVLVASGVPAELSIPVTIMYRVVSMSVQLIPGYILYQQNLKLGFNKAK